MLKIINSIRHFDIPLLVVSGLLVLFALIVQYSISLSGDVLGTFYRQLTFAGLGLLAFLFFAAYNYHNLAKINRIGYVLLILSLVYLLLFGEMVRGSARWINLGFFQLQPAEIAKVIIGIGLARYLYLKRGQINSWKNVITTFVYASIPAVLVFLQPDLDASVIMLSIWFGMLMVSPVRRSYLVVIVLVAVAFTGISWQFALKDYQKNRVETFLNPDKDPRGTGYNARQAMIAVGSGEWFGRGLGRGLQSQLKFLPERHTDFIFASASEEIGFLGSASILTLFGILFLRLIKIMNYARDDFAMYITSSVLFLFLSQVVINIGMNIGLLPVTGIPLPFFTYGGSSFLVMAIALGIVQNIARQSKTLRF